MKIKPFPAPIYVTRPFLPPLPEFYEGLEEIWETRWLTNNGPIVQRFEKKLSEYFQTDNICLFNNGTLALQIALQGMELSGEVITTPFTFVATTHALFWNKIRPVFCDIEPEYFTIDPDKVEELITPWTTAILAVHVFGHPCQLEKLQIIARKHNLKLIYDAAHAFGVQVDGKPITQFGNLSMLSFHATKLFHTFEGGALAFREAALKSKFNYLKNFGFKDEVEVVMPGTNAKMTEIQALMGIQVLQYIDKLITKGKQIDAVYRERLSEVPGIKFRKSLSKKIKYNYSYVPVLILEENFGISRDELYDKLREYNVLVRRYFYPIIPDYACYKNVSTNDSLATAHYVSGKILTLPTYYDLSIDDVNKICDIIVTIRDGTNQHKIFNS
jgi:dTDP-4-amino-4,6-dideoxygalactose transaminase